MLLLHFVLLPPLDPRWWFFLNFLPRRPSDTTLMSFIFALIAVLRTKRGVSFPFYFLITALTNEFIDSGMDCACMRFDSEFFTRHVLPFVIAIGIRLSLS